MSQKYHVNAAGEVAPCNAKTRPCKYAPASAPTSGSVGGVAYESMSEKEIQQKYAVKAKSVGKHENVTQPRAVTTSGDSVVMNKILEKANPLKVLEFMSDGSGKNVQWPLKRTFSFSRYETSSYFEMQEMIEKHKIPYLVTDEGVELYPKNEKQLKVVLEKELQKSAQAYRISAMMKDDKIKQPLMDKLKRVPKETPNMDKAEAVIAVVKRKASVYNLNIF